MKPFLEVVERGDSLASIMVLLAVASVAGLAIFSFQQWRGKQIPLGWWLIVPGVPWIASGPVAALLVVVMYGWAFGAEPETNARYVARVLGDTQSIRAVGTTLSGLVCFVASFALAIAALRVRAPGRRRIGGLIALSILPSIALTALTVFGSPRIYFAFAGLLLIGSLPFGIAAASCGEDRRSGALASGALLALLSSFAALVLGQMVQIEARAMASLPTAAPDARPQLVLAMLLEMEALARLIRVVPLLILPVAAFVWWARRRSSLVPGTMIMGGVVVLVPLLLHGIVSTAMDQAKPSDLGVELVSIPRPGKARIDHLLTDQNTEWRGEGQVAVAANVSPATLRAFLERAGSSVVLVGDAAGWMERISLEEIATHDPSAVAFARTYGTITARISADPIGTSTTGHVLLKDQSAQELIDALLAAPETVIHLR